MARFHLNAEDIPLIEQLKALGDEELLDFWEETHYLRFCPDEGEQCLSEEYTVEYERLILQELQYRSSLRTLVR